MGFLPEGASAPKQDTNYLKLIEGEIRFRVVSDAIWGYEYWKEEGDKKIPVRLREYPKEKPADVRLNDDGSYTVKHFWAFKVIDQEDGRVKIFEITQNGVKRNIEELLQDADWGDPKGYDIKITGTGKGMERRYSVIAVPHKPLTKEENSLVARTEINLEALYEGENPFGADKGKSGVKTPPRASSEATDDFEVKLEDIPFD